MDDTHRGVLQGDVDHLEAAITAVEKQPWVVVVRVAGEFEPRPVAVGGAKAEWVGHVHVAAGSAAVGQPYWRRTHRRQQCICCKCVHQITTSTATLDGAVRATFTDLKWS